MSKLKAAQFVVRKVTLKNKKVQFDREVTGNLTARHPRNCPSILTGYIEPMIIEEEIAVGKGKPVEVKAKMSVRLLYEEGGKEVVKALKEKTFTLSSFEIYELASLAFKNEVPMFNDRCENIEDFVYSYLGGEEPTSYLPAIMTREEMIEKYHLNEKDLDMMISGTTPKDLSKLLEIMLDRLDFD